MRVLLLFFFLTIFVELPAQTILNWSDLEKGISWKEREAKTLFPSFLEANFSDKLMELEGSLKIQWQAAFFVVMVGLRPFWKFLLKGKILLKWTI